MWLFFNGDDTTSPSSLSTYQEHRISDYGMTNFTMTVMDKDGKPARVINGEKMSHYPDDDSTEIIFPTTRFVKQDENAWLISSDHGRTEGKGNEILLTGHVEITQENNNDLVLDTDKLTIDTVQNTAFTDSAVTMKSPYGETNSVGLHADLQDKTINLHSRVKGQYDAPSTH